MNKQEFKKLHLLYKIIAHIAEVRQTLVKDLVAYSEDPVRYKRRMRLLIQLSDYEHQLLIKINNLNDDPSNFDDMMLRQLKDEVSLISDSSS